MLPSCPVLFSTVQPIWIHLSARCSSFPSVVFLFTALVREQKRNEQSWDLNEFLSFAFTSESAFKICSVEKLCKGRHRISSSVNYIIKLEQHRKTDSECELSNQTLVWILAQRIASQLYDLGQIIYRLWAPQSLMCKLRVKNSTQVTLLWRLNEMLWSA